MPKFLKDQTLREFQKLTEEIYKLPDDRLFSLPDLVSNQSRFTMRAIKGIRKKDPKKLKTNLLISFSWIMAMASRLHIDVEAAVLERFPSGCSYCGQKPCACKKTKPAKRAKIILNKSELPKNLSEMQKMFKAIYPSKTRSLSEAGVHLAEETGEVSEAIHWFLGTHQTRQFEQAKNEIADWVSCACGVANSANIDLAKEFSKMFCNNCHVCHKSPCVCSFGFIATFKS